MLKKVNLIELQMIKKNISDKKTNLCYELNRSDNNQYDQETDGTRTKIREVRNWHEVYEDYSFESKKFEEVSNILAKYNANTIVIDNLTIVDVINKLKTLESLLSAIKGLDDTRESKTRKNDGVGSASYYRVVEFNFDKEKVDAEKERLINEINRLNSALTTTNTNTIVEIDY